VAIIRFETNIPQRLTLKFDDGREADGMYGKQFMYTLAGGDQVYLQPIVDQKLKAIGARAGDTIEVCKREAKGKKGVEWTVEKIAAQTQQPSATPAAAANAPQSDLTAKLQNALIGTAQPNTPETPYAHQGMSAIMAGAYIASIDALITAQKYAAAKGLVYQINSDNIQTSANSIFIQYWKQMETNLRYGTQPQSARPAANGGDPWRH